MFHIEVRKRVYERAYELISNPYVKCIGLCSAIKSACHDLNLTRSINYRDVYFYIECWPELEMFEDHKLNLQPYWWPSGDREPRLTALGLMIAMCNN